MTDNRVTIDDTERRKIRAEAFREAADAVRAHVRSNMCMCVSTCRRLAEEAEREAVHAVKCWPEYYSAIYQGIKPFDARRNDRGYRVGDTIQLHEWIPETRKYTGRFTRRRITYVLRGGRFGIDPGYVVLGLAPIEDDHG